MSVEKKLVRRGTKEEAPVGSPAEQAGPNALLEQARQFAAVAAEAHRECEEIENAEQELQRRRNTSGE